MQGNEEAGQKADISEYNARAKRGFLWLFSTTAVWQAVSWLLTLVTARLLTPADYGLLAMNEAVVPYLMMVTTFKLPSWIVQRDEYSAADEQAMFGLGLILGIGSAAAAFLGAPLVAAFYGEPKVQLPFQAVSVIFIFRALQIPPEARLMRALRLEPIAVGNLVLGVLRGVIQLVLAWFGFGYWALIIGLIFREAAAVVWLWAAAGGPHKASWDLAVYKTAFKYGAAATASMVFWIIFSTADNVIVGKLFGVEILGFYAMAFYLAELPLSKINSVIGPLLVPYFSRIRINREAVVSTFFKLNKGIIGIVSPVLIGLAVTAEEVVPLLLGERWLPLIPVLQIMCLIGLWRAMTASSSPLLLSHNRPGALMRWSGINAVILPLYFFVFGSILGLPGIYATWIIVYPISGVFFLLCILEDVVGISPAAFIVNLKAPLVSTLLMALAVYFLGRLTDSASLPIDLAAKVIAGMAAYPLVFLLFFRSELHESIASLKSLRN